MAEMSPEQVQSLLDTTYDPTYNPNATQLQQQVDMINKQMEASQPNILESYAPLVGEIGGSVTGAIMGAKRGAVPVPPAVNRFIPKPLQVGNAGLGAVMGAVVGRGTGEVIADLAGDEVDVLESLQNAGEAGMFAYGGEKVFQLGGKVINAFYKARAGKALDAGDAQTIRELHGKIDEAGIMLSKDGKIVRLEQGAPVPEGAVPLRLTPGMLTNSKVAQGLEKIGRAGIGGGKIEDVYVALDDAMVDIYKGFESIAREGGEQLSREQSGLLFQNTVKQFEDEVVEWAAPKFAQLDEIGKGQRINMKKWFDQNRSLLAEETGVPLANKGTVNMLKQLGGANNSMTYTQVFKLMQNMNNKIRDLSSAATLQGGKKTELDSYKRAIKELHDFVEIESKGIGGELYDSYKAVSNTYKSVMQNTRSDAMEALVVANPEMVGQQFASTVGDVTTVRSVLRSLDETSDMMKGLGKDVDVTLLKQQLQAGYVKGLMDNVVTKEGNTAVTRGSQLLRELKENKDGIHDTFKEVLPKDVQSALMKGLQMPTYLEKQAAGNFSLIVRGRQSGSAMKLFSDAKYQIGGAAAGLGAAGGGQYADSDAAVGLGSLAALGFLFAPSFIARAAVHGNAGKRMLDEAAGIIKSANMTTAESVGAATGSALSLAIEVMGDAPVTDLPPELQVEGAQTAADALMYLQLEQQAPKFGFPVTK